MRLFKTSVTFTFHTTREDVVEYFGPKQADLERNPQLRNETPEMMIQNKLRGMKDINEGVWEPHALPPEFSSVSETVDIPDDQVQSLQTMYRIAGKQS